MLCPKCGSESDDEHQFCVVCGHALKDVSRAPITFTDVLKESISSLNPRKPIKPLLKPTDVVYDEIPPYSPVKKFLIIGLVIMALQIWISYLVFGTGATAPILTSFAFPFIFFIWMWRNDRYEREPLGLIIFLLGWGVVSVYISSLLNPIATGVLGSPGAALVEEPVKALGLYWLATRKRLGKEFNDHMDGIIWGAGVGLGFAWIEDLTYMMWWGIPDYETAILRGLTAFGHSIFTGLTGRNLGIAKVRRGRIQPTDLLAALIPGVLMHFVWNALPGLTSLLMIIPYLYIFWRNMKAAALDEESWGYRIRAPVE